MGRFLVKNNSSQRKMELSKTENWQLEFSFPALRFGDPVPAIHYFFVKLATSGQFLGKERKVLIGRLIFRPSVILGVNRFFIMSFVGSICKCNGYRSHLETFVKPLSFFGFSHGIWHRRDLAFSQVMTT